MTNDEFVSMSFGSRSLDHTIDAFFSQLTNFTKGIKEDVLALQRTLENGYSLTPQELREQLKQLEKRIKDVRKEAEDIEGGSFGELSLAELAHRSWTLYQETNNGISDLETHLRNYGYHPDKSFETVSYEQRSLSPVPPKSSEASCPLTNSKSNWLNFDYTNIQEEVSEQEIKNKTPPVSSKNQSTFSDAPFSFSRNLLTLKNKYEDTSSENQVTPRSSGGGSFAFEVKTQYQEESMEVDEIAGTPCENLRESFATDFSIPFSQPPRLSFEVPAVSFGSPFRSPNKRPEYSVFFPSPAERLISKRQYEELPDSIKMNLSFEHLNRELKALKASSDPLRFSEDDQNKVLLQGLELLGFLKKKLQDESVVFCPTEKWNQ